MSNRPASEQEIGYLPVTGRSVNVNPPALAWLDEPGAKSWIIEISRDSKFREAAVKVSEWPWLLYTHTEPLEPGEYYWRYRFAGQNGDLSNWSQIRSYVVPDTVQEFPRPSAEALQKVVPAEHPRMFVRPEKLSTLKATAATTTPELERLLKSADSALEADLMAEPRPWTGGKWNVEEWRGYLKEVGPATSRMDMLAFAWMLTDRQEYGARAKEHLMNFARWDPSGPSSMRVNDEVGMPVLYSMSRTYDWIYPLLDKAEKQQITAAVRTRGEEAYKRMRITPYEQFVFNSHFGRMWHFLGEAGVAFYGEIPEAEKWLNYAMTIFYGWYPYWGDSDGGWAEGIAYWSSYNNRVTWWLDLMRESLNIDGAEKPFYNNVADFPMFISPPGHPVAGFGDFSERPRPGNTIAHTVASFARLRQDSAWQWYADEGNGTVGGGLLGYLRSLREKPEAKAPADLPLLKVFQKSGIAAFHTNLENPAENFHVAMRCSEFGNVSHSHNDQNAVIMSAYGEPLLVNTGVRDFYGSPFCKGYYWHTRSHNALLIDGQGQERGQLSTGSLVARGISGDRLAWVVGDATNAYPGLADLYRRWTIFLPDYGAVIVDELETTASQVSILFHARAPFQVENSAAGPLFTMNKGNVCLRGIVQASKAEVTQTEEYPVPLHESTDPLFDEWHLRVDVPGDADISGQEIENRNGRRYLVTFLEISRQPEISSARTRSNRVKDTDAGDLPGTGLYEVSGTGNTLHISKGSGDGAAVELKLDLENLHVVRNR